MYTCSCAMQCNAMHIYIHYAYEFQFCHFVSTHTFVNELWVLNACTLISLHTQLSVCYSNEAQKFSLFRFAICKNSNDRNGFWITQFNRNASLDWVSADILEVQKVRKKTNKVQEMYSGTNLANHFNRFNLKKNREKNNNNKRTNTY